MGKRLFTAPNDLDVLLMVRDGRLERWDKYGQDVPPELDAIVRRSLAKDLGQRFQSAAEFRDALEDLQFKFGMRVGPADIGLLASDLFDSSPDAVERLKEHGHRWQIRPQPGPPIPAPPVSAGPPPLPGRSRATPESDLRGTGRAPVAEPASTVVGSALDDALAGSVSLVGLDQYETPGSSPSFSTLRPDARTSSPARASGTGGSSGAIRRPAPTHELPRFPNQAGRITQETPSIDDAAPGDPGPEGDAGEVFPPPLPGAIPDNSGDLSLISPMRAIADLAVAADTGLIRFVKGPHIKDVYLVRGAPESVNSNMGGDRFGEYLVTRGFLRSADLERALAEMPRFGGKFGESLVGLGFMRPLDVFRLLSQHVRERVMELFTWADGAFAYYRGLRNPSEAFPLGLSSFEILGAGVVALSYDFLGQHFDPLMDFHPRAMPNPRISPEAFRLGPTPREVLGLLDGNLTLRGWSERFASPEELLTFYRTLYLLVECSMAQFE
jgi:hypothetical protein